MKNIKLILRTIVYLSLAIVFFLELVNLMQFTNTNEVKTNTSVVYTSEQTAQELAVKLSSIQKNEALTLESTLEKQFGIQTNNRTIPNPYDRLFRSIKERYVFFDYLFNNNNILIPVIYLLTLITFLLQTILLSFSYDYYRIKEKLGEKKLDAIFLYSSEWTINVPPVLGVVGTIFSLGMLFTNLDDMSSLSTVFKDNFSNAALTTIVGGCVYSLNLFLNIFIAKNLVVQK